MKEEEGSAEVIVLIIGLSLLALLIWGMIASTHALETAPCSEFGGIAVKDIPVRCSDYYHLTK